MKIQSIDYRGSIVDGPGIRTVLYMQGCEKHCPGCHNQVTWDHNSGISRKIDEIVAEIRRYSIAKKLTISGGEPLLQYEALLLLVQSLSEFNIAIYTGYELENVPKELLLHIDYLKVGPFIADLKSTVLPYVGSSNQKFLHVNRVISNDYKNLIG